MKPSQTNPIETMSSHKTISRQLLLLLVIFFIGFGLQTLVNYLYSTQSAQLDEEVHNLRVETILANEIVQHIREMELQFHELTSLHDPRVRKILTHKVKSHVHHVKMLIDVLEYGGTFSQALRLNLPDKEELVKEYDFFPTYEREYDILKIDVLPKFDRLVEAIDEMNISLDKTYYLIQNESELVPTQLKIVQDHIKMTTPLFARILESANRIYYEEENRLQELESSISQQKRYYQSIQYSIIAALFIFGLLSFKLISRHIQIMAEDLQVEKNNALMATQSKSTFLANMSHEIRTPLNAITGFIQLLKEQEDNPNKLNYLKTIDNSSQSLLGIINDILDFSKIESNKLEFDHIDFDPHESFSSVADLFKAKCSEKNILLKIDMDPDIPHSLHSDPLRIKQVISNLLSNAVKFTEAGKSIRLEIEYNKPLEELNIAVIDQGIGIPAEKQEKVFEAFSQAETSTTRQFGGTGLGLAISSLLVKLLGGHLSLESEEGKGSKFFFTLPVKEGKPIKKRSKTIEENVKKAGKILLVEDNKTNQMLMGAILKKMGIDYDLAEDGLLAVEAYQNEQYELILMDENMPNMSGSEATIKIREIESQTGDHVPIVALTANAMKGDRERFLEAGMDDYLTKPLKIPELNRIIQTYFK